MATASGLIEAMTPFICPTYESCRPKSVSSEMQGRVISTIYEVERHQPGRAGSRHELPGLAERSVKSDDSLHFANLEREAN